MKTGWTGKNSGEELLNHLGQALLHCVSLCLESVPHGKSVWILTWCIVHTLEAFCFLADQSCLVASVWARSLSLCKISKLTVCPLVALLPCQSLSQLLTYWHWPPVKKPGGILSSWLIHTSTGLIKLVKPTVKISFFFDTGFCFSCGTSHSPLRQMCSHCGTKILGPVLHHTYTNVLLGNCSHKCFSKACVRESVSPPALSSLTNVMLYLGLESHDLSLQKTDISIISPPKTLLKMFLFTRWVRWVLLISWRVLGSRHLSFNPATPKEIFPHLQSRWSSTS